MSRIHELPLSETNPLHDIWPKDEPGMLTGPIRNATPKDITESLKRVLQPRSEGEDCSPPEFSEDALALAFTKAYGDDLRYTAPWSRWHHWDGTRWKDDSTLKVFDRARIICRQQAKNCMMASVAKQITSARVRAAIENLARSDRRHAMLISQWDQSEWLLNTPGGTVDLETGVLREARRTDYITRSTTVTPDSKCAIPRWLAFLKSVTGGDDALIDYLQRVCGYCLTGSTRERAMFFLYGTGSNGKSTFICTFSGIIGGDYARTAPIETFVESQQDRHPTELAMLRGSRLVTAVETEQGRNWSESKLKALTGGDKISARFMCQDFFEFTPTFKLLVAGNHKPSLRSVDVAMRARIQIVPFVVTIPPEQMDLNIGAKLRLEWPGILAWAVEGCKLYLGEGLNPPSSVKTATNTYFESEDALGRWIEDRLERSRSAFTPSGALFQNWQTWAIATGETPKTMTAVMSGLEDRLIAMGWKIEKRRMPRGWAGVALKRR